MKFILTLILFFILAPLNAWGFVPHEYPAVYTHQIGCIFYLIALIFFLWAIVHHRLHKDPGWRYLFISVVFFILWDLDIFISRLIKMFWLEPTQTIGITERWQYFTRYIKIESKFAGLEYIYYIGRFDFILLNVAMFFFYMGLKKHLEKIEIMEKKGNIATISAIAFLPLLPIVTTEIAGNIVFIILSLLCVITSIKLYKNDRENVLWYYMVWLSLTYFVFSLTRSLGHILMHTLIPTGNKHIWENLYLEEIGGSLNTSTRFLVATLTLFFIWIYKLYLGISADKKKLEISVTDRTILIEQLEKDKMELKELDKLKSAFLANVSHELRTPMNSIIGYTGLLLDKVDGPINEEQEKSLKKVATNASQLLQLINAVLDISRIEARKIEIEPKELDLKWLIDSIIPTFEPLMLQKGLMLTINTDKNLPLIYGEVDRIRQILINLLSNAVKFTNKGGITISAKPSERGIKPGEPPLFAEICVEDTGIGIKEDDLNKIFDKFTQVDFSYIRQYEGAGLGLSIARGLVALHKGVIWATSKYGEGSKFCFTIPLKKEVFEKKTSEQ
ncbi:MAG: ATP-binding protein [Nitrospirota bacterium]|nr:ATP-binding protein [Nitrospirota bacterium]MDH5767460.1 ATP-binding protein [Nitrospirota bacterium]